MMARWGSLAANLSRLAWSSQTENVQNVFRARPAFRKIIYPPVRSQP
jgi:hypothetical protein